VYPNRLVAGRNLWLLVKQGVILYVKKVYTSRLVAGRDLWQQVADNAARHQASQAARAENGRFSFNLFNYL
jgi:hypothetical protein